MYQSDFSLTELKERRNRLCDEIGNATALIAGAPITSGSIAFRQYNDFYYLCGVETPHAYLLIDGKTRKTTLFVPEKKYLVRDSDDLMICVESAAETVKTTGVDAVKPRAELAQDLASVTDLYTFLRDGEGLKACVRSLQDARKQIEADPWDGQLDRGAHLCEILKSKFPNMKFHDIADIIYLMRMQKSPAEVKLIRHASQLSALGLCEAMRATRPGIMEYQLAAAMHYHYLAGGARDTSYPSIVGGGQNAFHGHYHANASKLQDGDLILVDAAPDYRCYTSDITRMWPVNGKFTPAQRALYGFVTEYHKTLLSAIRPGRMIKDIEEEAVDIMSKRVKEFSFATKSHASGPEWMFAFRKHCAHSVGLSVHDGLSHMDEPLKPGMVFSVDPQMKIEEDRLYLRVEDTGVVTENGFDVLTKDAPYELNAIESMMQGQSILDLFPPHKA